MAITFDFLHSLESLWDFTILFIICGTQRRVAGSKFYICSQSMSYGPVALLLFRALIPGPPSGMVMTAWIMFHISPLFMGRVPCFIYYSVVVGEPPGLQ